MAFAPLALVGVIMAALGRSSIVFDDGEWRGSMWAWVGYLGGTLSVIAALALLAFGLVGLASQSF
jgi:hypothetical protein